MSTGILTAGSGQSWESELVAALDKPGAPMTVLRRCVDIADVLAETATGQVSVVVVSSNLRRLDTEAVRRWQSTAVAVVAIYPAADHRAPLRLERIGISHALADDAGAAAVIAAARSALLDRPDAEALAEVVRPTVADPMLALPLGGAEPADEPPPADPPPQGRVVAVWGPTGAPGRTTVAAGIAAAAAHAGEPTLLIDADVFGGVLANAFGLLDESPGLAGACRLAANGRLDLAELTALVWAVGRNLRLLTGISRADRWPEVRPSAIPAVLGVARSMAPLVVVDCGFALEADEEITFDTVAPRRNGATLAVLGDADLVLAVGSADPPGMERLVRGLAELADVLPDCRPRVVLNRTRKTSASIAESADALYRFAGLEMAASIPEDRSATDKAWQAGIPVLEAAPSSALSQALAALTAIVRAGATARQHTH